MAESGNVRFRSAGLPPWWNEAPVRWRELLLLLTVIVAADVLVYRGHGFTGLAVFLAVAPLLLAVGAPRPRIGLDFITATTLLMVAAIRLSWLGSVALLFTGCVLLVVVGMTLAGRTPYFAWVGHYLLQIVPAGLLGLIQYGGELGQPKLTVSRTALLGIALPAAAVLAFGTIFVMANPDLANLVGENISRLAEWFEGSLADFLPQPVQVLFWIAVAWFTVGLWRPLPLVESIDTRTDGAIDDGSDSRVEVATQPESPFYSAYRNTFLSVVILFGMYLVFEFRTLWFREFPDGFYCSGYAHQGAAWLTFALALATVVLSMIFRGQVLQDPRCSRLRRWGWLWSAENGLLALAVFNRLGIYVQFNGMTRMRVVGVLGICSVIVGFLLVLRKVTKNHSFLWLLRRQMWTVCFFVWLFLVLPVDLLVHSANTQWVLAGHTAPAVQISEHPLDAGGLCAIAPLLRCDDPIIRNGVRALYARAAIEEFGLPTSGESTQRYASNPNEFSPDFKRHWTAYQGARQCLLEKLRATRELWSPFEDGSQRATALGEFHSYTKQWW